MARDPVRSGPIGMRSTALALVLALVAWPIVTPTMGAVYPHYPEPPASALGQWSAALGAVLLSALVAAPIGQYVVRRRVIAGGLLTCAIALAVAVASVPLLPVLLGQQVGVGCESAIAPGLASSSCDPIITTTRSLVDNLEAVPFFWLAPIVEPILVLVLAVGVTIWTVAVARMPWLRGPAR
jgi:ABC-type branched-subunit amino acid transport system permease subunit